LEKLRVDFYESGDGETIIITFPGGGLGIVDAHPSPSRSRPDILSLTKGKTIHFACLTHPHADHGVDLIPLLESHPDIRSFWHTASPLDAFIFWTTETTNYPSPVHQFAHDLRKGWADFLTDLYGAVARRDDIQPHLLQSNLLPAVIDGVEIHCLSPDEAIRNKFERVYRSRVSGERAALPNPNSLSAILALRWGSSVALLGGDARKENWDTAHAHHHHRKLPKAIVFKVPHHGARNAMNWQAANYLDLCARAPNARAVLFAGDADHPDADVYRKLRAQTDLLCLANGLAGAQGEMNPLQINLPGARAARGPRVCNPVVSIELDDKGNSTLLTGNNCEACPAHLVP
jgi:hypothetical protein